MAGGSQYVYRSFHNPRISAARACSVQSPYPGSGARYKKSGWPWKATGKVEGGQREEKCRISGPTQLVPA